MNLIDPTLIYLKASFATTAKTYQSLPSEFIFFSSFTMVKPGFCAKISSQISDPQKTTVNCRYNFVINVFNPTFEVQNMGMRFKMPHFETPYFQMGMRVTFASGQYF